MISKNDSSDNIINTGFKNRWNVASGPTLQLLRLSVNNLNREPLNNMVSSLFAELIKVYFETWEINIQYSPYYVRDLFSFQTLNIKSDLLLNVSGEPHCM